jgi:hypothetical protein
VDQLREPLWLSRLNMMRARQALFEGRFQQASMLAEQAFEIGVRGGHEGADVIHLVFRSHLGIQIGVGLDAIEAQVRRFVENGPHMTRTWHAHVLAGMGRLDEASALWDTIVPHLASVPREAPERIIIWSPSAELCVALGDRTTAGAVYEALLPYADRQVIVAAHTPSYGPASLALGMLAMLLKSGRRPEPTCARPWPPARQWAPRHTRRRPTWSSPACSDGAGRRTPRPTPTSTARCASPAAWAWRRWRPRPRRCATREGARAI